MMHQSPYATIDTYPPTGLHSLSMITKPTIRFDASGVPNWNDERGGVHIPTSLRTALEARRLPQPNIVVKQMTESFIVDGDPREYHRGDFVALIDGKFTALTAEEFAREWEIVGGALPSPGRTL